MSKFLAPIHFWPYDKIKVQEELTAALADFAHERGWDDGIDCSSYVSCDLPALDTVIDEGNIHCWLQARIVDAEGRYAQLVSALVCGEPHTRFRNSGACRLLHDKCAGIGHWC